MSAHLKNTPVPPVALDPTLAAGGERHHFALGGQGPQRALPGSGGFSQRPGQRCAGQRGRRFRRPANRGDTARGAAHRATAPKPAGHDAGRARACARPPRSVDGAGRDRHRGGDHCRHRIRALERHQSRAATAGGAGRSPDARRRRRLRRRRKHRLRSRPRRCPPRRPNRSSSRQCARPRNPPAARPPALPGLPETLRKDPPSRWRPSRPCKRSRWRNRLPRNRLPCNRPSLQPPARRSWTKCATISICCKPAPPPSAITPLWRSQAASGMGIRSDAANARNLMETYLRNATNALNCRQRRRR